MNRFNIAWILAMIILISLGAYLYLHEPKPVPLKMDIKALPFIIGEWKLVEEEKPRDFFKINRADTEIMRIYKNASDREINLYFGYFEFQGHDKGVINSYPEWLHKKVEEFEILLHPQGPTKVQRVIYKDSGRTRLHIFWYHMNGRIVIGLCKVRLITILNSLIRGRTDGAIIIVSSNLEHPNNLEKVIDDEVKFIQELIPILDKYLPSDTG